MDANICVHLLLMSALFAGDYATRREAAEALRVDQRTIDRWIRLGRLEASQIVPNGTIRISVASIERLLGR